MKQKNLILMVVAVGCGLLAAFLTSQMSAKPAAAPTQVEVLVVAKELPPGTKFTLDSIKDQFKKKLMSPEVVPEKAVVSEEALDGKMLNKTLRTDDFLRESDLGNYTPLDPPEGKHVVTLRLPVDKMTPFVQPNSKVDIVGTLLTKDNKVKSTIMIPNMLVMAIDTNVITQNGGPKGDLNIQLATMAATREEAMAIRLAEAANVKLSFILRSDGSKGTGDDWTIEKVVDWINGDDLKTNKEPEKTQPTNTDKPKDETTKMTVPVADLPAGTELTNEIIQQKFKEINWLGTPPTNAVINIKEHVGRFLVKDIVADQFVPKAYVNDKPPQAAKVAELPKGKSGDDAGPSIKPDPIPEKEAKKLQTFDRSFSTPAGTKTYRYEIQENGDLKMLGEVTGDGGVAPPAAPAPKKEV